MLTWFAEQAMSSKHFAKLEGIQPVSSMPLFEAASARQHPNRPSKASHADWLRGAVAALLPKGYGYAIHEDSTGKGRLEITRRQDGS